MSVYNMEREENKDIKKCFRCLDDKRKKDYFKSLHDAMPKDFNTVDLQEKEEALVLKEMEEKLNADEEHWRGVAAEAAHMDLGDADSSDAGDPADAEDPADDALAAGGAGDWRGAHWDNE